MKNTTIKLDGKDVVGTVRGFLAQLLESGFVSALLVPKLLPGSDGYAQSLLKDTSMLCDTNPLAPTMPVQSAKIMADLTRGPLEERIGVVLKPCELRATVELVKFLQVDLDSVVTIGIDCTGTYAVKDYAAMKAEERESAAQALLDGNMDGVRECCRTCEYPAPLSADITLCRFGSSGPGELSVLVADRVAADFDEKLPFDLQEGEPQGRENAVREEAAKRRAEKDRVLGKLKDGTDSVTKLLEALSTCVRCLNCMEACPICYCKECVFKSAVFEQKADQLLKRAAKKGAARMPADTLIFHMTRMSHMATSCVACGMCESACPNELPVASLFKSVGGELQEMFEYVPGRDPAEEPPVSAFKEDELQTETGTG